MAENGYLIFVSKPTGYELLEREGDPPGVGDELDADELRSRVSKIGPSPLPGDHRPCVYLQPIS